MAENLEKIVKQAPWKIVLSLNLMASDIGSTYAINKNFDENEKNLKHMLGDEKFREVAGVVSYANSMMLDFESALKYALIENKTHSLLRLQENAILYGRSDVVCALDDYGRDSEIRELIIDRKDMQKFLVYHALPQVRLYKKPQELRGLQEGTAPREEVQIQNQEGSTQEQGSIGEYCYAMDHEILSRLLSRIEMDPKQAIRTALELLERNGNENI